MSVYPPPSPSGVAIYTTHCTFQFAAHVCYGVQAVPDLYELQGALVRSWHGAAREAEGVRVFDKRGHEWTTAAVTTW